MLYKSILCGILAATLLAFAVAAQAITIETVPVGNPGNAGELSGWGAGGVGPDRICGTVNYSYKIGKYEVTAGQYTAFLNAVAKTDVYGLYNTDMWSSTFGCKIQQSGVSGACSYSVSPDYANRPVNYVSWGDSARFANWLHNGQPTGTLTGNPVLDLGLTEDGAYYLNGAATNAALLAVTRETDWKWAITNEDEWYKAAYYKGGSTNAGYWDYPTGSDTAPGCDVADASGNNANYSLLDGCPIGSPYYRTPVGEFSNSPSPCGTFDQGGNVWEWNEEAVYNACRGARGGSFINYSDCLLATGRTDNYPEYEDFHLGFRVASVPEPGSLATLSGIALTALLYWWRKRA